jgi:hypothetical protein
VVILLRDAGDVFGIVAVVEVAVAQLESFIQESAREARRWRNSRPGNYSKHFPRRGRLVICLSEGIVVWRQAQGNNVSDGQDKKTQRGKYLCPSQFSR